MISLAILPLDPSYQSAAQQWSLRLQLPLLDLPPKDPRLEAWPLLLGVGKSGLQVISTGRKAPGPVQADFLAGAVAHRRRFGGGKGQLIAKAVGVQGSVRPRVADVTAGLGRDGFVLATLGCQVELVERVPVIAALLEDALQRAEQDHEIAPIVERMRLHQRDAREWLQEVAASTQPPPEVIYLDPMFPHSDKSALVKKEMRVFRDLVGDDADASAVLDAALACQPCRVVVKRPRKAPAIDGVRPSYSLEGKSGRFDIYALRSLTREEDG